eukprot:362452-Chlamydomonas_euryale.AAC.2
MGKPFSIRYSNLPGVHIRGQRVMVGAGMRDLPIHGHSSGEHEPAYKKRRTSHMRDLAVSRCIAIQT